MRNRNVGINIRVSEKEKEKIVRNASKCQLTVSEYLRKLANGHEPKELPRKKIFKELADLNTWIARADGLVELNDPTKQEAFKGAITEMYASVDKLWGLMMSNFREKAGDNDGNN